MDIMRNFAKIGVYNFKPYQPISYLPKGQFIPGFAWTDGSSPVQTSRAVFWSLFGWKEPKLP